MPTENAIEAIKAFAQRIEGVKIIQPLSYRLQGYDAAEPAIHLEIKQG